MNDETAGSLRQDRRALLHWMAKVVLCWRLVYGPITVGVLGYALGGLLGAWESKISLPDGSLAWVVLTWGAALIGLVMFQAGSLISGRADIKTAIQIEWLLFWLELVGCFVSIDESGINYTVGINTSLVVHWLMRSHLEEISENWG